jgi:hypothetical protein
LVSKLALACGKATHVPSPRHRVAEADVTAATEAAIAADANTVAADHIPSTGRGRHAGQSAADPSQMTELERLRFEATVNGRYHTSRQGWYEGMHRLCMFVVVLGGTAAFADAAGHGRFWFALIPTVAGTIDLVFDFTGKAAQHARLQERSYEIVAEIELATEPPEILCRRGFAEIARICAQESKTMRVVHALAYNDTKEGTQADVTEDLLVFPWWAGLTRHLHAYDWLTLRPAGKPKEATSLPSAR